MILTFQNMGGLRILPWNGGSPVLYGFDPTRITRGSIGEVDFSEMIVPNATRRLNLPILDVDNFVYVKNASVLTPYGESFDDGGYLGTVQSSWTFKQYDGGGNVTATETLTMESLGIIAAPYVSGLVLDNVSVIAGNMTNRAGDFYGGTARGEAVQSFESSFSPIYSLNWWTDDAMLDNAHTASMTSRLRGGIGMEAYYSKI